MPGGAAREGFPEANGISLSIILPAYNESRLIASRLDRLARHVSRRGGDWEIIVVNDGSTDETSTRVTEAASREPRIRLVSLPVNVGKGAAIVRGMKEARGSILATTDADLSYALSDLDAAVDAVAAGSDVAAGSRRHAGSRINLPFGLFPYLVKRWITGGAFRLLVRWLYGLDVSDTQCGLKAYSRRSAEAIAPKVTTRRFLADIEIFLAARGGGLKVVEVPVHLRYLSNESTVHVLDDLPRILMDLARIKAADMRGAYD
jgi:dolichyl-phosphate beta-glucosyltransferase